MEIPSQVALEIKSTPFRKSFKNALFSAVAGSIFLASCSAARNPVPNITLSIDGPETLAQYANAIKGVLNDCHIWPAIWDGNYIESNKMDGNLFYGSADFSPVSGQSCYKANQVTIPSADIAPLNQQKAYMKKEALGNSIAFGYAVQQYNSQNDSESIRGHTISLGKKQYRGEFAVLIDGAADMSLNAHERKTLAAASTDDTYQQWDGTDSGLSCPIVKAINTERKQGDLGPLSDGRPLDINALAAAVGCS